MQYLTKVGGQVAIALTKSQQLANKEAAANSMIYKVPVEARNVVQWLPLVSARTHN